MCQVYGGWWTGASRLAALAWQEHRELLLASYGCDVCRGEGDARLFGSDLHTPSRDGGWALEPLQPRPARP